MNLSFQDENQNDKIKEIQRKAEENQAKKLSQNLKLTYLDLRLTPINPDALALIPKEKTIEAQMGVFQKKDRKLLIAALNSANQKTQIEIDKLKKQGYECEIFIVSLSGLKNFIWPNYREEVKIEAQVLGEVKISPETILDLKNKLTNLSAIKNEMQNAPKKNTTQIIELALAASLAIKASDIHFQPEKNSTQVRFRIDGSLENILELNAETYQKIKNRLKLVSNLSLNIVDAPQDGRFTIKQKNEEIEVRVSTLPGGYGEGIVMRVLDPAAISVPLEKLGLADFNYQIALEEIKRPNGMIILTGPTGSGKTTTLYAFLNKLNNTEVKIITVEDPIEYKLAGVSQTQIEAKKGLTFAAALRSILRQDPDIILVGEMRDTETAETAIQAALTGHIVFSTLHTNDAAGAITRLIDIGAKPAVIAPALNLIIAQRLIRKICAKCQTVDKVDSQDLEKIKKELDNVDKKVISQYPTIDKNLKIYKATGCGECNNGYKGRIAIHELIKVKASETIKNLIIKNANQFEIKKAAIDEGLLTLKQDGYLKVLLGITTIEEIDSVAD